MAMLISKFHKIIQSKVVWGAFAVIISVAFVSITVPGSRSRGAARRARMKAERAGRLFGEDVSRHEFSRAYQDVYVGYILMTGRPITVTDEIDKAFRHAAWQRIAMLKKARQLGMEAQPQQIVDKIQSQPLFMNRKTGQFDKAAYNAFVRNYLPRTGMSEKDLEDMFAGQVLIDKVSSIPAQGALAFDDEIKRAFHLYTDTLTVEYATIPRDLAKAPKIDEAAAKAYYEAHKEDFRMPEKVAVDYVQFAVADFTNQVAVTDDMVSRVYEANKERFVKPSADTNAPPEYLPLEEVKGKITKNLREQLARAKATDKADELVASLADVSVTFKDAARKAGLKIHDRTPSFTKTDAVKGVDPTAPFQRDAFTLQQDSNHYYSDPVVGRDFVYVLALRKKYDSFIPSFDVVRDDVFRAAQLAADEEAYQKKAEQIEKAVKAAVKQGKSFADAVAEYKLEVKSTKPFKMTDDLDDEFAQQIKQSVAYVDQGKVADLATVPDGLMLAYVAKRDPGDEATALPAMRAELVDNIQRNKARLLVSAWREDLLKEAHFEDLSSRDKKDS